MSLEGYCGKFQQVSCLGSLTAAMSLDGDTMYGRLLGWYNIYIHFWGLLPRNRIFLGEKFTLFPSLPFSYIANVTARPSSNGHQRNFVAWYKEWNYGTFIDCTT